MTDPLATPTPLRYRGAPVPAGAFPARSADLVYRDYVTALKNSDLTSAEIDNVINTRLASYANMSYVDNRDTLNATKAYVDDGDSYRLHLDQKTIAGGVCPLDATGRVPPNRIDSPLTQKWVRGPWTPAAYFGSPITITTETSLYSCPVTSPGYPYKLVVFGHLDARSDRDTEFPLINVRAGTATGEIVAQGAGSLDVADSAPPTAGETFAIPDPGGVGELWNATSVSGSGGQYAIVNGEAAWQGTGNHVMRYRRLGPVGSDVVSLTDYQKVRLTIGSRKATATFTGTQGLGYACARMNVNETDWVGFSVGTDTLTMKWSLNGTVATIPYQDAGGSGWQTTGSEISTDPSVGTSYDILCGVGNSLRTFYFYRNNVLIGQAYDSKNLSRVDSGHRGWGFMGAESGPSFFTDPATPPSIAAMLVTDAPPSFGSISVMPAVAPTVRTGPTTLFIRAARSGSASTQTISPYRPRLSVFVVPA